VSVLERGDISFFFRPSVQPADALIVALGVQSFFFVLGVSAALWGGWLERAGPRKAGVVAACCWAGGPPRPSWAGAVGSR